MGSDKYDDDEKPIHNVSFSQPFLMAQTEITFEQYDYFIWDLEQQGIRHINFLDNNAQQKSQKISYPDDNNWGRSNHPAIYTSWYKAQAYSNWLSKKTGLQCRLPSEAEWEYTARAGTKKAYWWGDEASHQYANYGKDECCNGLKKGKDKWLNTSPVGSFESNKFGLYDMHGNIYEWVQDCDHGSYKDAPNNGSSWESKNCGRHATHGEHIFYFPTRAITWSIIIIFMITILHPFPNITMHIM